MKMDMDNLLDSMLKAISEPNYIDAASIPNIDLYVDQVTTFMEEQLGESKRYDSDKILTKTMINNYAKNNLLPPPIKKKYSKKHVLVMSFIYYFKSVLSIKDIETILAPITEHYFDDDADFDIESIYNEVVKNALSCEDDLKSEISKLYQLSQSSFTDREDISPENKEYLQIFSLLCALSFDVYMKKALIERIIDQLPEPEHKKKK